MENKVIKNMEYWKKKNNIPGIEALADSGLTDGRAGSSAFQMAAPVTPSVFGEDENTEVGKELLKEEAKEAMQKSPLEQVETMVEEKPVNPTEKIYVNYISDSKGDTYKEGDLISEDDLEGSFKKTGNDPKDYPQLSVQDYSEIRADENGLYVQRLKEGEQIKGLEVGGAMGGVGETPMEMQSPVKNYKKGYYGIK
mgnify:CR=1 FL=1|jgi:hypothetical protein